MYKPKRLLKKTPLTPIPKPIKTVCVTVTCVSCAVAVVLILLTGAAPEFDSLLCALFVLSAVADLTLLRDNFVSPVEFGVFIVIIALLAAAVFGGVMEGVHAQLGHEAPFDRGPDLERQTLTVPNSDDRTDVAELISVVQAVMPGDAYIGPQ